MLVKKGKIVIAFKSTQSLLILFSSFDVVNGLTILHNLDEYFNVINYSWVVIVLIVSFYKWY